MFIVFLWILKRRLDVSDPIPSDRLRYFQRGAPKVRLNYVDTKFLQRLVQLLKLTLGRREAYLLSSLTLALVGRTLLSIYLTSLNARIVKAMIQGKFSQFLKRVLSNFSSVDLAPWSSRPPRLLHQLFARLFDEEASVMPQ